MRWVKVGLSNPKQTLISTCWLLHEQEAMQTLAWQCHKPTGKDRQPKATVSPVLSTFLQQDAWGGCCPYGPIGPTQPLRHSPVCSHVPLC